MWWMSVSAHTHPPAMRLQTGAGAVTTRPALGLLDLTERMVHSGPFRMWSTALSILDQYSFLKTGTFTIV